VREVMLDLLPQVKAQLVIELVLDAGAAEQGLEPKRQLIEEAHRQCSTPNSLNIHHSEFTINIVIRTSRPP
jgi:hypothetical protein